jgi:hypothetical protein
LRHRPCEAPCPEGETSPGSRDALLLGYTHSLTHAQTLIHTHTRCAARLAAARAHRKYSYIYIYLLPPPRPPSLPPSQHMAGAARLAAARSHHAERLRQAEVRHPCIDLTSYVDYRHTHRRPLARNTYDPTVSIPPYTLIYCLMVKVRRKKRRRRIDLSTVK